MSSEPSRQSVGLSRRAFVQSGAAATLTAAHYRRVWGANDRVSVGFIGFGLIGKRHVLDFQAQSDAQLTAVAETHRGRRDEAAALIGGSVKKHDDFRRMLDDPGVDAVVVSTPDHWHALLTMMACAAGKDVYVEKPLTLFVREGRWMADVARKYNRIVQVGTQQRSGLHYQRARKLIQDGAIGQITSVRMGSARNIMPGFGSPADCDPPPELNWDLWLGPAPSRRYNPNRCIYHFRWFWDYSGGQMTNLGQHALDIVHWFLNVKAPTAVTSVGGRHFLRDNGETPDTQETIIEYPGFTATWSLREASRGQTSNPSTEFFGTKGSLAISRSGFTITPDRKITPDNAVPQFTGAHPVGGPVRVRDTGSPTYWTEAVKDTSGTEQEQFRLHARNFLDCIKSRKEPISDLESSHRVVTVCHLANLSLKLGRKLTWDAEHESAVGDPEATRLLERTYRTPWDQERKHLLGG
jgi:predicted dehydrogenase